MATHYTTQVQLNDLTPPQFLALCVNAAHALGWDIKSMSDAGLIALTSNNRLKVVQKVTIRIGGELAELRSESIGGAMADWGRNRKAVERFTDWLIEGRASFTPEQLTHTYDELRPGFVAPDEDVLTRPVAAT